MFKPCDMNNVLQKASDAKAAYGEKMAQSKFGEKASDAKAAYDEKKAQFKSGENKESKFIKLKGVLAETTGAPVLGPGICIVFNRLTALFAVFLFLYTLWAAVPTFYEKISFASVEFLTVSHPLPRTKIARTLHSSHLHLHRGPIVPSLLCRKSSCQTSTCACLPMLWPNSHRTRTRRQGTMKWPPAKRK